MAKEVDAWLTAEAEAAKNGPPAGAKSGGGMQMLLSGGGASCVITNESDPFQIVAIAQVGADVEILFASCADHVYQLQSKTEMTNATWETVATIAGDNSFTAWVATNALASNYLFWRVKRAPREADSDFDFWRDGAELDAGYDATDAGSHPDYDFNIDGGVDVVTNAQLQFDFPGLLADFVILSESITMSNSVTNAFVAPLTFTLLNTNDGLHTVFLQLLNTGGTPSPVFGRTIELDTHPPTVSITAPSNGVTVATRRVNLTGFAADASTTNAAVSDARRPLQTTVTGDFVNDRATNGVWWAGPQELAPGTNSFVAVATDRAGWTASNSVWFVYDPTLATNLPVFTVDVTNTITVASNTTTIALSGWINDDNATVQIAIIDPTDNTITNAIVNAAVHGANWWGEVPMLPGSNRVVVIAQNAGSAPATNSFTAIQDPNVFLAINNPAAGSTANTNSVLVVGMASTNFTGTITINGGAAATSLTSSGIVFSGSASINNIGANLIEIQATGADGSVVTTRATVYGYEFLRWAEMLESSSWHVNDNCWYIEHFPHSHPYRSEAYGEFEWNVPDTHYSGQGYGGIYAPAGDCLSGSCGDSSGAGNFDPTDDLFIDGMGWFRSTVVIDGHHLEPAYRDFSNCVVAAQEDCIDAQEETVWAGQHQAAVSFIKHWPVDEEQTVVLHFGDMQYWTGLAPWWQGASDPEKITFWGQKGIFYSLTDWGSTNVGFVVKIKTNTRYTISENDFTFPTTQATQTHHWPNAQSSVTEHAAAHMLQYWGLGNDVIQLSSTKAFKSPVSFAYAKTDIADPCTDAKAPALMVYYRDVINQSFEVQPFDVKLQIIPGNNGTVSWSKHNGPASGALKDATKSTATFSNPTKGGLYQFDLDFSAKTTRTQFMLPLAGPEIKTWTTNEVHYLQTWATNYRTNAGWTRKIPFLGKYVRAYDLLGLGMELDWTGHFTSASGPCLLPGTELSFSPRHTICGIVVDRYRLSNLLTAYLGRAMTGLSEESLISAFGKVATPDDEYDVESYRIGFNMFIGLTLEQAMQAHGYTQQKPGTWDVKLWPNDETPTGGGINRPPALN